jgi:hypothetical protein
MRKDKFPGILTQTLKVGGEEHGAGERRGEERRGEERRGERNSLGKKAGNRQESQEGATEKSKRQKTR